MHWLMIALLVSLGALLLATGGLARHIWLHRARQRKAQTTQSARGSEDLESEP